ncbi:MAG: hypothetical protein AAF558_12615 [Verrucomicrobiota bacterium]
MDLNQLDREKSKLILKCDEDRRQMVSSFDELDHQLSVPQLGMTAGTLLLPKLKLLVPVLGFVLPSLLRRSKSETRKKTMGLFKMIGLGISILQKTSLLSRGLKVLPKLWPR